MPATSSRDARDTDEAIRATVTRLCRPGGYGGTRRGCSASRHEFCTAGRAER
jgi:hypothetical protein